MDGGGASSSFPGTSFAILSVSIVGILAISLLLLAYYLFLTRCGLLFFWRPDLHLHDHHHHRISVSVTTVQEPPRRSGLEEAAIRRIPTFRYRDGGKQLHQLAAASSECAVCLADFRAGERLRLLPPCLHAFHIDCIDAWLQATANCPLCRAAVAAPSSTDGCNGLHCHLDAAAPRATDGHIAIDIIGPPADERPAADAASGTARGNSNEERLLPMRRSLSMDSSTDKRFYLALQSMLQQNSCSGSPAAGEEGEGPAAGKGDSADDTGGARSSRRLRRSFFSFSQSRGSRSAVLPL